MLRAESFYESIRRTRLLLWLYGLLILVVCFFIADTIAENRRLNAEQTATGYHALLDSRLDHLQLLTMRIADEGVAWADAAGLPSSVPLPDYVVAAGFQQRVGIGEREGFETALSYKDQHPFYIREYRQKNNLTWPDDKASFPAAPRSIYIPLTIISGQRPINQLDYLFGIDLLTDAFFSDAAKATISNGTLQISKAFNFRDGRRGIALMRASHQPLAAHSSDRELPSRLRGIAIVLVDIDKLLSQQSQTDAHLRIQQIKTTLAATPNKTPEPDGADSSFGWLMQRNLPVASYLPLPYRFTLTTPAIAPFFLLPIGVFVLLLSLALYYRLFRYRAPYRPAQVALPSKRQHWEHIALKSMEVAVMMLSGRHQILYANPYACQITGDEELQGKLLEGTDFGICTYRQTRRIHILNKLLEKKQAAPLPDNCFLVDLDGNEHEIEGELVLLASDAHQQAAFMLLIRKVGALRLSMTESLKQSEQQLKKHKDELARIARINTLGEMSSGVAHEINQPLSAIMSYNEACLAMLDDTNPDPVLLRISLTSSIRQASRAGQIIRRLREIATRKQPEMLLLNINDAMRNALDLTKNELATREVMITTDLADDLPPVMADNVQLEQVIINLLKNAVDAMTSRHNRTEAMRIFVYTEQRGRHVRLGVRDNGTGIPADILPHVFDPFFSSKTNGMGLGLTISQTIIESIGGKLAAKNLDTGGAEFSITLPMAKPAPEDTKEEAA